VLAVIPAVTLKRAVDFGRPMIDTPEKRTKIGSYLLASRSSSSDQFYRAPVKHKLVMMMYPRILRIARSKDKG